MFLIPAKTPAFIPWLFPRYTWKKPSDKKELYLTFDDGPIPEVTTWVLDQLEHYNAKATFFCIGDNIEKHPEVFESILKNRHAIGNHTQNHLQGWNTNTQRYLENTYKAEAVISKHSKGYTIPKKLFRPPFGKIKSSQSKVLLEKGYEIIMWRILTFDWKTSTTPEHTLKHALKARNGDIIVFHDSLKASKNIKFTLPKFLEHFSKEGYEFKALY